MSRVCLHVAAITSATPYLPRLAQVRIMVRVPPTSSIPSRATAALRQAQARLLITRTPEWLQAPHLITQAPTTSGRRRAAVHRDAPHTIYRAPRDPALPVSAATPHLARHLTHTTGQTTLPHRIMARAQRRLNRIHCLHLYPASTPFKDTDANIPAAQLRPFKLSTFSSKFGLFAPSRESQAH